MQVKSLLQECCSSVPTSLRVHRRCLHCWLWLPLPAPQQFPQGLIFNEGEVLDLHPIFGPWRTWCIQTLMKFSELFLTQVSGRSTWLSTSQQQHSPLPAEVLCLHTCKMKLRNDGDHSYILDITPLIYLISVSNTTSLYPFLFKVAHVLFQLQNKIMWQTWEILVSLVYGFSFLSRHPYCKSIA